MLAGSRKNPDTNPKHWLQDISSSPNPQYYLSGQSKTDSDPDGTVVFNSDPDPP